MDDIRMLRNPLKLLNKYINAFKEIAERDDISEVEKKKINELFRKQAVTIDMLQSLEARELDPKKKNFVDHADRAFKQYEKLRYDFRRIHETLNRMIDYVKPEEGNFYHIEIGCTPSSALNKKLTDFVNNNTGDKLQHIVRSSDFDRLIKELPSAERQQLQLSDREKLLDEVNYVIRQNQTDKWSEVLLQEKIELAEGEEHADNHALRHERLVKELSNVQKGADSEDDGETVDDYDSNCCEDDFSDEPEEDEKPKSELTVRPHATSSTMLDEGEQSEERNVQANGSDSDIEIIEEVIKPSTASKLSTVSSSIPVYTLNDDDNDAEKSSSGSSADLKELLASCRRSTNF